MSVCIIDTSVFCNILRVPGRDQRYAQAMAELDELLEDEWSLLLPVATIYETGNHIANATDGGRRRSVAGVFVDQVTDAFHGEAPWTPTPVHSGDDLTRWLAEFPDSAMGGVGLADLSIIKIWEEQCLQHPARRVRIWAFDHHLSGYDRDPVT